MSPSGSCVEALTPIVTVFDDRAFGEVIKVNEVIRVELLSIRTGVLVRRGRDTRDRSLIAHVQRKGLNRTE